MSKIRTHYDNLKVARNAPDSVIRAAYKALMHQYHPDKYAGGIDEALRIAKIIKHSYDVLIDPTKRAEHDRWIDEQKTKTQESAEKLSYGETREATEHQYYQQEDIHKYQQSSPSKYSQNEITKEELIVNKVAFILLCIFGVFLLFYAYRSVDFWDKFFSFVLAILSFYIARSIQCTNTVRGAETQGAKAKPRSSTGEETEQYYQSQGQNNSNKTQEPPTPPMNTVQAKSGNSGIHFSKPWPRFLARHFDLWWESTVFGLLLIFILSGLSEKFSEWILQPQADIFFIIVILPLILIFDAVLYHMFGNTLGKALLGIKVKTIDGKPLNFDEYLSRNFSLWKSGLSFGIPLINFYTMWKQFNRIKQGQQTSYDEETNFRVWARPMGWIHKVICVCTFTLALVIQSMLISVDDIARREAKNVNSTELWTKPSSWNELSPTKQMPGEFQKQETNLQRDKDAFVQSAYQSCYQNQRSMDGNTGVPEKYIADYCTCTANSIYGKLTVNDVYRLEQLAAKRLPLPPDIQNELNNIGRTCIKSMIRKMTPSELEQMDILSSSANHSLEELYYEDPDAYIVKYAPGSSMKIIKIKIAILVEDENGFDSVKQNMAMIRNNIFMAISSIGADKANTTEGKIELRALILKEIGLVLKRMTGNNPVKNIYYTEFVMQ